MLRNTYILPPDPQKFFEKHFKIEMSSRVNNSTLFPQNV